MSPRRSEIYAPLAALFLALVALISSTAALEHSTNSLEKSGRKFTDAHKAQIAPSGLLLAGLSDR